VQSGGNQSVAQTVSVKQSAGGRQVSVSSFQVLVVLLCMLANAVDGYDTFIMAFVAPAVAEAWSLTGGQLGSLFSANLVGMAVGAVVLSSWSDRVGRRPVVLTCLGIVSGGMLLSAFADSLVAMAATRAITGMGVGGMIASSTILVAEHVPDHLRSKAINLLGIGYLSGAMGGDQRNAARRNCRQNCCCDESHSHKE
jgi:MFS family permease